MPGFRDFVSCALLGLSLTGVLLGRAHALHDCVNTCGEMSAVCGCCEDMENLCPEIADESRRMYKDLIGVETSCTNFVWMISSCPAWGQSTINSETLNDLIISPNSKASHLTKKVFQPSSSDQFEKTSTQQLDIRNQRMLNYLTVLNYTRVKHTLENRPVYDLTTGLVFQNWTIFKCCNMNQSKPILWQPVVPAELLTRSFSLDVYENLLTENSVVADDIRDEYIFTLAFRLRTCYHVYAMKDTMRNMSRLHEEFVELFSKNVGFDVSLDADYKMVVRILSLDFVNNIQSSTGAAHVYTWQVVTCDLQHRHPEACSVNKCKDPFTLTSNGECRFVKPFAIGLRPEEYSLSQDDTTRLPEMVSCFLKEHLHVENVHALPTFAVIDVRTNTSVFVVQTFLSTYSQHGDTSEDATRSLIVGMLAALKRRQALKTFTKKEMKYYGNLQIFDLVYSELLHLPTQLSPASLNNNTLSFCYFKCEITPGDLTLTPPVELRCVENVVYDPSELGVESFIRSSCFSNMSSTGAAQISRMLVTGVTVALSCSVYSLF